MLALGDIRSYSRTLYQWWERFGFARVILKWAVPYNFRLPSLRYARFGFVSARFRFEVATDIREEGGQNKNRSAFALLVLF